MNRLLFISLVAFYLGSCGPNFIHQETIKHFKLDSDISQSGDSLFVYIENGCQSPADIKLLYNELSLSTLKLPALGILDTVVIIKDPAGWRRDSLIINYYLSGIQIPDTPLVSLPFRRGDRYKIIQGYNSNFSHNRPTSRHAIDFNLLVGDTIYAASDGFVVEMVEGYKHGGANRRYRPYANFITLYHPDQGIYTRYAHLIQDGSFVDIADTVIVGEPIGISGKTGFTDVAHLHFTAMGQRDGTALLSIPSKFTNGLEGKDFKKNDRIQH